MNIYLLNASISVFVTFELLHSWPSFQSSAIYEKCAAKCNAPLYICIKTSEFRLLLVKLEGGNDGKVGKSRGHSEF